MKVTTTPEPVSVTVWGELRAERKLPGTVLRVLVAGQSAGGAERHESGAWVASWYAGTTRSGSLRDRVSEHATAEDAVRAVIRSRGRGGSAPGPLPGCTGPTGARRAAAR